MTCSSDPLLIERNLRFTYELFANASGGGLHQGSAITWVKTLRSYWPNYVLEADLTGGDPVDTLAHIKQQMFDGHVPKHWVVGPSSRPTNLGETLISNGFIRNPQHPEWAGMVLPLGGPLLHHQRASGLTVDVVRDEDGLRQWTSIVGPMEISWLVRLLEEPSLRFYLGRLDDQLVACSMASFTRESVGLYMIGVLPKYRNQGIGKAMTLLPMLDGLERGCRFAVLQATPMGERIYLQLGFEECSRYQVYRLDESKVSDAL